MTRGGALIDYLTITCKRVRHALSKEHQEPWNPLPLRKSTTTRGGVRHACVQHPAAQTATSKRGLFCSSDQLPWHQTGPNWQTVFSPCYLYLHFTATTSSTSAGTEGHHGLQSFSLCKSTINLLCNIDVMDFVNTQAAEQRFTSRAGWLYRTKPAPTTYTTFAGCSEPHRPRQR